MKFEDEFREETGRKDDVYSWELDEAYIDWIDNRCSEMERTIDILREMSPEYRKEYLLIGDGRLEIYNILKKHSNNIHTTDDNIRMDYYHIDKVLYCWKEGNDIWCKRFSDSKKLKNFFNEMYVGELVSALNSETIIRFLKEEVM